MINTKLKHDRRDFRIKKDSLVPNTLSFENSPTFNFVINYPEAEISDFIKLGSIAEAASKDIRTAARIVANGDLTWCLQTFLNLSRSGSLSLKCSNTLCEDSINIIHSDTLLDFKGRDRHFIVCVQADYPRRQWSHYHIVQNKNQVFRDTSYIPHWVQPGLIKRDASRTGVKRVAYSGQTFNKNLAGSEHAWKKLLEPYGIEFVTLSNESWHDLSEIDVLIGIRSFDSKPFNNKPPSKLFNAWHAGIPFIGGYDSAYKQVGEPGKDYLLVKTQQEALEAILKLQNDPVLYNELTQKGRSKALIYNQDTITKIWEDVLTKSVAKRYRIWKERSQYERLRFYLIRNYGLLHHKSKQVIKKLIT